MALGALKLRGDWNHNTHYNRLVLRLAPAGARAALDVGCGEGELLKDLARVIPSVTGIDAYAPILNQASRAAPSATVIHGDFLTYPFRAESFDLIAAIASLHHMDAPAALARVTELLRPGGRAVIVGVARPDQLSDYMLETAGVVASRCLRLLLGYKEVCAPTMWPPPHTYEEYRRLAIDHLPGAQFRRRLFFRYSLIWTKPSCLAGIDREPCNESRPRA